MPVRFIATGDFYTIKPHREHRRPMTGERQAQPVFSIGQQIRSDTDDSRMDPADSPLITIRNASNVDRWAESHLAHIRARGAGL